MKPRGHLYFAATLFAVAFALPGCDQRSYDPALDFGGADFSDLASAKPLPFEFQGDWFFSEKLTLAEWKKTMPAEAFEKQEKMLPQLKALGMPMHTDLSIAGSSAIGKGALLKPRYDLIEWTRKEDLITGRAWHHEDQHDPGDMAVIHLRLRVIDGELIWDEAMEGEYVRYIYTRIPPVE